MKSLVCWMLVALMLLGVCACQPAINKGDIATISGSGGLCTAFQVEGPSHTNYLLSAGHCAMLANDKGEVLVTKEDGSSISRRVLKEVHEDYDLLLIEGLPGVGGLHLANAPVKVGDFIEVFGHGLGLPCYERYGLIIGDTHIGSWIETATIANVQPGHSGSPAFNAQGAVVGVVSMGGMGLGLFVRLQDVKAFLKGY